MNFICFEFTTPYFKQFITHRSYWPCTSKNTTITSRFDRWGCLLTRALRNFMSVTPVMSTTSWWVTIPSQDFIFTTWRCLSWKPNDQGVKARCTRMHIINHLHSVIKAYNTVQSNRTSILTEVKYAWWLRRPRYITYHHYVVLACNIIVILLIMDQFLYGKMYVTAKKNKKNKKNPYGKKDRMAVAVFFFFFLKENKKRKFQEIFRIYVNRQMSQVKYISQV